MNVPHLRIAFEVVGGHLDLLLGGDALLNEVGLAPVDEGQRVGFAVELGEIQLLEPGRPVTRVLAEAKTSGSRLGGRWRWLSLLQRENLLLHGRHALGEFTHHLGDVGVGWFSHGW